MYSSNFKHLDKQHQEKVILALKEVILGVTGSFDLDTLLQKIVESCINLSKSSRGSLFLYDEESDELVMRAEKNNAPRLRFNARYQINVPGEEKIGLTTYVFKTGETLALNSLEAITSHPAHLGKYNKDSNGKIDCQSLICIPLKTANKKTIGVIKLENVLEKKESKKFSEKDIYDLELIAGIVTQAITNFQHQSVKIDESINTILSNALKSSKPGNLTERLRQIATTFKKISNAVGVSIWLIEGSRLICKGAVGRNYKDLEEKSYDLSVDISKAENIGLTLWIAKSGETINIKTHKELTSHPQYKGTYDDVLYPDGITKCESFIGAPLKTGNEIIGVIKADSRLADEKHPEKFFTTEEVQIFSYLSIITSIIVEREQEFKINNSHNQQLVELYKLGTECYEFDNSDDIFGHLLTGLTHGEGIGYNRAIIFNFSDDKNQPYLTGLRGLGPRDKKEGDLIHHHFDLGNTPFIEDSKRKIKEEKSSLTPLLQEFIENQKISLSLECNLYKFIQETLKSKSSQAKLISIKQCSISIKELLEKLESFDGNFLAFSFLDGDEQVFIGFCDNVYSHLTQHGEFSIQATNTFVSQISLALSRLSLKKTKEETTEEAWQEFTAITAHRIGTETSIMSGALNFFKKSFLNFIVNDKTYSDEYSISWKQDLDILEKSLNDLKRAVRDHTELQKPPEINPKPIQIGQILDSVKEGAETLQSNIDDDRKVSIIKNYSDDLPMIFGDWDFLNYAFKELYDNAIKAMSDGGQLKIYSHIKNEELEIRIEDNGTGIESGCLEKIFNRGFRNRPGGTGLGLYIVKRNIELHGGKVIVENNKNGGATFYVTLPIENKLVNGG